MLTLYHGSTSVCSIKVRIALAERGLEWNSRLLDLQKGDQFDPEYLRLNPEAVVPTLVDGQIVVRESSVIIEHLATIGEAESLIPEPSAKRAQMRLWLLRTINIHEAINSLTYATLFREKDLATLNAEEVEARIQSFPNPQIRQKRREIFRDGVQSVFVSGAIYTLRRMLRDMESQLEHGQWLLREYSLADIALIAYVDRLERLGFAGLWKTDFPRVAKWLKLSQSRPSYSLSVDTWITAERAAETHSAGSHAWPAIEKQISALGV